MTCCTQTPEAPVAARGTKLSIAVAAIAIVALGGFIGIRTIVRAIQTHFSSSHCDVGNYEIDTDQASVAAQMVGAATKFTPPLPEHASVLALMAGLQESKLTNIAPQQGDRDSVGVLQQRPSQGWGHHRASVLTDVTEATHEFLAALVKVPHWRSKAPADAIQAVQISADGSAYAQHEDEARALAAALLGHPPGSFSCTFDRPTKVATTAEVIGMLRHQLPVHLPHANGKTIRVPGAHWQTAAWFIANADRLGIDSVAYDGKRWSRADGWKAAPASASAVVATLATV
jgi:hypothetical protein